MNQLKTLEHKNIRVLSTKQLAESYCTDEKVVSKNFVNNKSRYIEGKHYFRLTGEELKTFYANVNFTNAKIRTLYLWTEKGALLHAKSLNTDQAWAVYDHLVETYFRARDVFTVPQTLPDALRLAADLAEKIERDRPKVLFAETCLKSEDCILVRELAKIIKHDGIDIGEHKLYAWLRKSKLLMPNNEPYQQYIDRGYFVREQKSYKTDFGTRLAHITKVTPRGQAYIMKRLAGESA